MSSQDVIPGGQFDQSFDAENLSGRSSLVSSTQLQPMEAPIDNGLVKECTAVSYQAQESSKVTTTRFGSILSKGHSRSRSYGSIAENRESILGSLKAVHDSDGIPTAASLLRLNVNSPPLSPLNRTMEDLGVIDEASTYVEPEEPATGRYGDTWDLAAILDGQCTPEVPRS